MRRDEASGRFALFALALAIGSGCSKKADERRDGAAATSAKPASATHDDGPHADWEFGPCTFERGGRTTTLPVWHKHPTGSEYCEPYDETGATVPPGFLFDAGAARSPASSGR